MQKKTLRAQITAYLSSVEDATATQITKHTNEKDYPSRVLRELNDMRTDTLIECGKKGKGRDLSYWLISAVSAPHAPADTPSRTTEGADMRRQIIRSAIAGKTSTTGPSLKDLAVACGVTGQAVEHLLAPMLSDGTVGKARTHGERFQRFFDTQAITPPQPEVGKNTGSDGSDLSGSMDSAEAVAVQEAAPEPEATRAQVAEDDPAPDFARDPDLQYLAPEDYEMPPPDPLLLASANRMLSERLDAKEEELLKQAALVVDLRDQVANATALADKLQHLLTSKEHECEALRVNLAAALDTVEVVAKDEEAVDVLEAASAYLVRAPKRKPRILTKPEAAREAALACARNGSGRGEVYALVHIGTARRGAEWKDA